MTQQDRMSVIGLALPVPHILPPPSEPISASDRAQIALVYSGPFGSALPLVLSIGETVSVTDTPTLEVSSLPLALSASETIGTSEVVALSVSLALSVSETVLVTESVGLALVASAEIIVQTGDGVGLTESVRVRFDLALTVSETLSVSESVGLSSVLALAVTDSISAVDQVGLLISGGVFGQEVVGVSEAVSLITGDLQVGVIDPITVGDNETVESEDSFVEISPSDAISVVELVILAVVILGGTCRTYPIEPVSRVVIVGKQTRVMPINQRVQVVTVED